MRCSWLLTAHTEAHSALSSERARAPHRAERSARIALAPRLLLRERAPARLHWLRRGWPRAHRPQAVPWAASCALGVPLGSGRIASSGCFRLSLGCRDAPERLLACDVCQMSEVVFNRRLRAQKCILANRQDDTNRSFLPAVTSRPGLYAGGGLSGLTVGHQAHPATVHPACCNGAKPSTIYLKSNSNHDSRCTLRGDRRHFHKPAASERASHPRLHARHRAAAYAATRRRPALSAAPPRAPLPAAFPLPPSASSPCC